MKYGAPKDYRTQVEINYEYIHGKAGKGNLILGIDEYLPADRKDTDLEFVDFKKYYQRINRGTDCKYMEWIKEINASEDDVIWGYRWRENDKGKKELYETEMDSHNLYIFGHSLDITDRDVLRQFLLNDKIKTKIFYLNDAVKERQIKNLVKIIGQEELTKRCSGELQTIEFIEQKEMNNHFEDRKVCDREPRKPLPPSEKSKYIRRHGIIFD